MQCYYSNRLMLLCSPPIASTSMKGTSPIPNGHRVHWNTTRQTQIIFRGCHTGGHSRYFKSTNVDLNVWAMDSKNFVYISRYKQDVPILHIRDIRKTLRLEQIWGSSRGGAARSAIPRGYQSTRGGQTCHGSRPVPP